MLEASDDEGPPPELSGDFGKLLETREGSDVTFEVEGEAFPAHKIVLATRSPVFKAELYGPVGEDNNQHITIQDMHSAVFRALLHYVYTDSLPAMEDLDSDGNNDMIKYLLVAADRPPPICDFKEWIDTERSELAMEVVERKVTAKRIRRENAARAIAERERKEAKERECVEERKKEAEQHEKERERKRERARWAKQALEEGCSQAVRKGKWPRYTQ
ncbi:hypothetical protein EJB05_08952, partial [Eragrostis curvula]